MQPTLTPHEIVRLDGLSNREFLERYGRAGCVGLSGGVTLIDRAICRAERHLDEEEQWGAWSHAFLFQGRRADGHHWVIESDLQVHHKHIQLGVQENRISKYFDEKLYTMLAVLDFDLTEEQVKLVVREGLELVANRARYSLRELFGTLLALRRPELRGRGNVLARERSLYCSALVRHLFRQVGVDLTPDVDVKNTTPEDIARTTVPHVTYWLERARARSKLKQIKTKLRSLSRRDRRQ
jgi:cell wall-associated NlpC family hydrolase